MVAFFDVDRLRSYSTWPNFSTTPAANQFTHTCRQSICVRQWDSLEADDAYVPACFFEPQRTIAKYNKMEANSNGTNNGPTFDTTDKVCNACSEEFHKGEDVMVLNCHHIFCKDCYDAWEHHRVGVNRFLMNEFKKTCPTCRAKEPICCIYTATHR